MTKDQTNLPWVEKYRPKSLDDLISHEDILSTITGFLEQNRLPHLLFYGPPGTGKTSTILACAKKLYSPAEFNSMVLELNASDDRGIETVRNQILSFASTRTIFNRGFKLIILDEADAMTKDAQNALRRVMEKFMENTRFCLLCNYLTKIIPAIQSRCTRFRFGPLSNDKIVNRLKYIVSEENLTVTESGMAALVTLSNGDMRKALNVLQSTSMAHDEVTDDNVYKCTGRPRRSDIEKIVKWMLNENYTNAYKYTMQLCAETRMALQDIIEQIHIFVHEIHFPTAVRIYLLDKLAEIEHRLAFGTSEKLQMGALVAAFQQAKNMVAAS
uniref:Activator 1 subunit 5 n=1 Tax=Ciona savignyi TaxID=51511 RepID=H2Z5N6_CIOSA